MISAKQIQLVQIARRKAGLEDLQYRTLLRNVAGVTSSKELGQSDFEDVLAVLEDCGFTDATHGAGYWTRRVEMRGQTATTRQVYKLLALAEDPDNRYELKALCLRFSGGRTDQPGLLTPREAWELTEMLKASTAREAAGPGKARNPKHEIRNKSQLENRKSEIEPMTLDEIPF